MEHPAEPPLNGALLTCSKLALAGARVIGHADDGAVDLTGAHIGGSLGCHGAHLRNDSGPALAADGLQVDQDMYLRDSFTATGRSTAPAAATIGAARPTGAHISGQLDCSRADLRNDSGPALARRGCKWAKGMFLRDVFTAAGSGGGGAARLTGAHIGRPPPYTVAGGHAVLWTGQGSGTSKTRVPQFCFPSVVWLDLRGMYSVASHAECDVSLGTAKE